MNIEKAWQVMQSAARRLSKLLVQDPIDLFFDKQIDFITDPHRLKCGFCTRRAGKTEACCAYLIRKALMNPNAQVLYIALTRKSA